jgi:CubicO group peptidase (beta-lactamase class C family)
VRSRIVSVAAIVNAVTVACLAATLPAQQPESRKDETETIRRMLMEQHDNGEFTGAVLVARAGTVIYRDAIAPTPDEARKLHAGPSNIASLSKTFTAMAVMMLAEQGKLTYDDLIARHVPELAGATPGITIRHLLTHTSGIPDVGDLGIDRPGVDEGDVVSAVRTHHARFARPGQRYRYSNTGYILLGMAVENVSGQTFDEFLQRAIFTPLEMNSTRPEGGTRGARATKGDGGLVSTVDDLLKWDRALAGEKLVRAKTFAEALAPAKVAEGESTYGFGWNIAQRDGQAYMWHTGNSGGQRAFIGRRVGDRIAIIILTNGNSRRVEIADAIVDILNGRPYVPPKLSIGRKLLSAIDGQGQGQGIEGAFALYEQLRKTAGRRYDFSEGELNGLGYILLERGRNADAIRVFELNVRQFPTSANVFDSLGEALYRSGQRAEAAKAYARVVELDPGNVNARAMLLKLK